MITDRIERHQVLYITDLSYKLQFPRQKENSQVMKVEGKLLLKDRQRGRKLFKVALKLTTVKMDLLVPKYTQISEVS